MFFHWQQQQHINNFKVKHDFSEFFLKFFFIFFFYCLIIFRSEIVVKHFGYDVIAKKKKKETNIFLALFM